MKHFFISFVSLLVTCVISQYSGAAENKDLPVSADNAMRISPDHIGLEPIVKKTHLITAATSGIGGAVCEVLASKGHKLILAGRNESKLNALKIKLLEKYRGDYRCLLFDYESVTSIQELGTSVVEPLDGLVIIPKRPAMPPSEIPSPELWNTTFNQCFIAPLEFIRVLSTQLKAESSLVVISGISSVYFVPAYANSNVLRIMWTAEVKNLSRQLANRRIRVNEVSPAVILTEYSIGKIEEKARAAQHSYEEQLALDAKETPLQRLGTPSDVANLIEFLLSDNSRHINGTNMILDGGLNGSY